MSFFLDCVLLCYICRISRASNLRRHRRFNHSENRRHICVKLLQLGANSCKERKNKKKILSNWSFVDDVKKSYLIITTLITLVDLPMNFYTYLVIFSDVNFSYNASIIFDILVLLGHLANVVIYLLFHKEFRCFILGLGSTKVI